MELEYDKNGKLKYHPQFHTRQRRKYTLEELEYLCKFCSYGKGEKQGEMD